jgi:hypothetical protein
LLDSDNSGFIEKKELINIVTNIKYDINGLSQGGNVLSQLKKDFDKLRIKFNKIVEIIYE